MATLDDWPSRLGRDPGVTHALPHPDGQAEYFKDSHTSTKIGNIMLDMRTK